MAPRICYRPPVPERTTRLSVTGGADKLIFRERSAIEHDDLAHRPAGRVSIPVGGSTRPARRTARPGPRGRRAARRRRASASGARGPGKRSSALRRLAGGFAHRFAEQVRRHRRGAGAPQATGRARRGRLRPRLARRDDRCRGLGWLPGRSPGRRRAVTIVLGIAVKRCDLLPRLLPWIARQLVDRLRTPRNQLILLARAVGFEPTTNRLTADCSTAELRPIMALGGRI